MLILGLFSLIFCIIYRSENKLKIIITPYREKVLLFNLPRFQIWKVTFLKSFYHKEIMELTSGFRELTEKYSAHCI